MSLKAKITLLTVAVTLALIAGLSFVQVHNVVEYWLAATQETAELAGQQVKQLLILRLKELEASEARAGRRPALHDMLASDPGFGLLLQGAMAQTRSLVEIAVADHSGVVVASSNPLRPHRAMPQYPLLQSLRDAPPWRRITRLVGAGANWQIAIPLGMAGDLTPLFAIHVLVSPVLLRDQVIPAILRVARWGAAALMAALVLVWFSTHLVTRDLTYLSSAIDRISSGQAPDPARATRAAAREFATIESKLNVLGHQFLGAEKLRHAVEAVLEGLQEAFLVFDASGRLSLGGGPIRKYVGEPFSAIAGRRLEEIFPPDTDLGTALGEGFRLRRPMRERNFENRIIISVEFGPATALLRIRDALGKQQLERQIGASVQADGVSRIMGAVAHEIKNPLNSISVRLDNLQAWASEELPEMEREIQVIVNEVNRLDRVVRTFLDLTRPAELVTEDVDMVALCRQVVTLLGPGAADRSINIELVAPLESVIVAGDHDMLKEAIVNVVTNGMEAMPSGGRLRLIVRTDGADCIVQVSDSGEGIPEPLRARIFDPYFTTKQNGSGLGLPRAFRALQLHGGAMNVESAASRGTDVYLRVPAKT